MRSQDSNPSGRRSSRRGPRKQQRYSSSAPATRPSAPLSFWDKVVAFFSGGKKPRPAATNGARKFDSARTSRRPEAVEVSSPKLYVGNLSFDATESDLFDLFKGIGEVKNAEIVSHRHTQKSKGFGFVTMHTTDEAKRAVEELHDKDFMGRKLVVSGAKTSERDDLS